MLMYIVQKKVPTAQDSFFDSSLWVTIRCGFTCHVCKASSNTSQELRYCTFMIPKLLYCTYGIVHPKNPCQDWVALKVGGCSSTVLALRHLHQQTAHWENLAKLAKPCETKNLFAKACEIFICESLQKIVFAKLCDSESCETNVKLRNLYLQNLAKVVFAKITKLGETLRNAYCENRKICENWVALRNYLPNH